jgi:Fic family protein
MSIGNKIKEYRENKKMTQKDIAEILEVEPGTVSKYESGTLEPNIESLKRLAETFEITVDELINEENETFDVSKINVLEVLKEQKDMKLKGNLYHNTQVIFAYNTNHIEGSKLTEDQTRYIFETNTILFDGETVASVDDILETANHFKLVDYMLDVAEEKLTEEMIKEFHKILKEGTMDSRKEWFNVGDYKKVVNEAGSMKTSTPKQTPKDMMKLMEWYNSLSKVTIKEIIEFHARFEKIHPFQDGNGRVGRIIAFKECLKNNIVPFIIMDKDKLFYYRGLKEYQNKTEKGYLIDTCLNAQDQYTKMIEYYLK